MMYKLLKMRLENEKNVDSVLFYLESLLIFDSQCKQNLMA